MRPEVVDFPLPRKQHVVCGVGVERWVEVDQVHALVADVGPQHLEIVAVIKMIGLVPPLLMITRRARTIAA